MESLQLKTVVEYASQHVQYYHESFKKNICDTYSITDIEDLTKIPMLDKNALQLEHDNLISDEYQRYPKIERIQVKRTIGNDGSFFRIYTDRNSNKKSEELISKLRNELYGIRPDDRLCTFFTTQYIGNKLRSIDESHDECSDNQLSLFMLGMEHERIIEMCRKIREFAPKWMIIKPSTALIIADVMQNENIAPFDELEFIELSGEYVSECARKKIEAVFGGRTIIRYSCSISENIAYEYPDGKLHILSDNAVVEVIKDGHSVYGEEGDVCITLLSEYSMPIIRFSTGDKGILTNDNGTELLSLTSGCSYGYITLPNKDKLPVDILVLFMEMSNDNMANAIKQFQIIQNAPDDFTVRLVIIPGYKGWKKAIEESILDNIRENALKNAKWNFIWEDDISLNDSNGNSAFFINNTEEAKNYA